VNAELGRPICAAGVPVATCSSATPNPQRVIDATTNRLVNAAYDSRGNVTSFGYSVVYDGENRLASMAGVKYQYDGKGHRVRSVVSGSAVQTTKFVYDAFGKLASEYGSSAQAAETGTWYFSHDHLGSTRLAMKAGGSEIWRFDYLPFGELIGASARPADCTATPPKHLFTGKERDAETGLDYFGAVQ
jgi:hypothetical protein